MTFLVYTSAKQINFSGIVIHVEGGTDENKYSKNLLSMLFFPPQFLCSSRCFSVTFFFLCFLLSYWSVWITSS